MTLNEEIEHLVTVKTFGKMIGVTAAYVYDLEKENKIMFTIIDGVKFVDTSKHVKFLLSRRKSKSIKRIKSILKIINNEK